jgi:hypothetical protein
MQFLEWQVRNTLSDYVSSINHISSLLVQELLFLALANMSSFIFHSLGDTINATVDDILSWSTP